MTRSTLDGLAMPLANPHQKFEQDMLELVRRQTALMERMVVALELQAKSLDRLQSLTGRVTSRIGSV